MKINELTVIIFAERLLGDFDSKKLVWWAVEVIKLGCECDNLYILAGLDSDPTEVREKYFFEALKDLKIEIELDEDKLLANYALYIAKNLSSKEIDIENAFKQMLKIVTASDYDQKYIPFYEINEDLDFLKYDNTATFNHDLTLENSKEYIREEFKIFLEMEILKIPQEERKKSYCNKCHQLCIPVTKSRFQLRKPFQYLVRTCSFCGSIKLNHNSRHETKMLIITEYKKHHG